MHAFFPFNPIQISCKKIKKKEIQVSFGLKPSRQNKKV